MIWIKSLANKWRVKAAAAPASQTSAKWIFMNYNRGFYGKYLS